MSAYAGRKINHIKSRMRLKCGNHGWVSCCLSAEKNSIIWGYGGMEDAVDLKSTDFIVVPVRVRLPLLRPSSKISHMTTSFMLSLRQCNGGWNRLSGRDIRDLNVTAMPQGLCDGYPATLHLFFCVCYYLYRLRWSEIGGVAWASGGMADALVLGTCA